MDPGLVKNLALGAIPPALFAGVFFVIVWFKRRANAPAETPPRTDWRPVIAPLVFAAAVVATWWIAFGAPVLPPVAASEWLPIIAVGAGVAGAVAALDRLPPALRWTPTALALALAGWGSTRNLLKNPAKTELVAAELLEFALGTALALASAAYIARRGRIAPILLLLLFAGAASQLLVLGYASMQVGQVVGMSASMLGAALVIALWRKDLQLGVGGAVFVVVLTMAGLLQTRLYGRAEPEMGRAYAALLVLSPGAAWLAHVASPQRWPAGRRAALAVIAAVLPLAVGVGVAAQKWTAKDAQKSENAEYNYEPG